MPLRLLFATGVLSVALAVLPTFAQNGLPCPADLDCSGQVNVTDLLNMLGEWGGKDSPADLNGDGDVNVQDLLLLLGEWGPCAFDYTLPGDHAEALQIALEAMGADGPLIPSQEFYDRVEHDLEAIRKAIPELADVIHTPAWLNTQILANVPDTSAHEYLCLNAYYQLVDEDPLFSTWYVLTFPGPINAEALSGVYVQSAAAQSAEPNYLIGGENSWEPTPLGGDIWEWFIDDGFHDCFDGCDCHRYYWVRTRPDGTVTLLDYQEVGQSWCVF